MALRQCPGCARYTLQGTCPDCGEAAQRAGPARYSPEDRFGRYRRALKRRSAEGRNEVKED